MPGIQVTSTDFNPDDLAYTPPTGGIRKVVETSLVEATPESIRGYGHIVDSPKDFPIEIVRWPAQGWRPVDDNSGDQGGVTEGVFEFWWKGDTLYARNNAVGDSYLFAWSTFPEEARNSGISSIPREKALIWRANYHPDGGQVFFPLDSDMGFVVPLALPGDDVKPEDFKTFCVSGGKELYIHPNIWHGAVVPEADEGRLLDRQGKVHARVSVDFVGEFGCYLGVPMRMKQ